MRVVVSCDHAGFLIKPAVIDVIQNLGHELLDLGTFSSERVDYPDFAEKAGRAIINGDADRGVVICGSGVCVTITLNKMKCIYACLCHDPYSAHQGVEHDDMNVLCLGGQVIGPELTKELVKCFLNAKLMDVDRYKKRISKIRSIESEFYK